VYPVGLPAPSAKARVQVTEPGAPQQIVASPSHPRTSRWYLAGLALLLLGLGLLVVPRLLWPSRGR
ncbi:MAG: hypothetical protein KJO07_01665, partial [Deltaproteobacteria bacterium]|nr:hypothetical protein [Deltaproteobacteria bacterium]